MEDKQTAVQTLFNIFKVMSKHMRDSGDEQYANTLEFLCNEFEDKTLAMEKEQLIDARDSYINQMLKVNDDLLIYGEAQYKEMTSEQYYNETYKQEKQ